MKKGHWVGIGNVSFIMVEAGIIEPEDRRHERDTYVGLTLYFCRPDNNLHMRKE